MGAQKLLAIERGDTKRAAEALETMLALGRACHDQPFLIEALAGWAIDELAAERVKRWLASDPSREELDAIERAWVVEDPVRKAALAIDVEAMCNAALVASVMVQPSKMRFAPIAGVSQPFAPYSDRDVRHPGSWAANRDAIEAHRAAWAAELALEPYQRMAPTASLPLLPSFARAGLAELLAPALGRYIDASHARRMSDRAIAVMIALERWRLEQGEYPESLDALVPKLLPSVPIDPWCGQPLGYRRVDRAEDALGRAYLIYSLGPDGMDDGGREASPQEMFASGRVPRNHFHPPDGFDVPLNDARPIPRAPTR